MGIPSAQRSCRAWGFLCFALESANHRVRCLTSLSLIVSSGPPRSYRSLHSGPRGLSPPEGVEALRGDAGDLPFYGRKRKRMARSGLTPPSLPFSLSLSSLSIGPLYSPPQSCQSVTYGQNKET